MSTPEMLTDDELVRIVRVCLDLGVRTVRLTGGEPLLRPRLVQLVEAIAQLPTAPAIAMTTNGVGLARVVQDLAEAGLSRVNISLDTVDPQIFSQITRRAKLDDVIAGLRAASEVGLCPVKVNAVCLRGVNLHAAPDLLAWCLERGYELRFIEQMPLDAGHEWRRSVMVTAEEIVEQLRTRFRIEPDITQVRGSAPAEKYLVDGGPATVGVIASVTAPFCAACDRLRITSDGMLRNCLFSRGEVDLRGPLRAGADDAELRRLIRGEVWRKAAGHGIGQPDFSQPRRPMSAIGG